MTLVSSDLSQIYHDAARHNRDNPGSNIWTTETVVIGIVFRGNRTRCDRVTRSSDVLRVYPH